MRMGPTQVMRAWSTTRCVLCLMAPAALERGHVDDYLGLADTLLIMMQQHNMKEENILYLDVRPASGRRDAGTAGPP